MSDVGFEKIVVEVADCLEKKRSLDSGTIRKTYLSISTVIATLNA